MQNLSAQKFPPAHYAASRGRILIVDDEVHAREALSTLLEEDGYEVRNAPDGFKALGVLREWECDLLVTDLRMPVMDGLELIKKARVEFPKLTCVVMTAFGSVENAVKAMKSGAEDYLSKPLNFDEVELVIARAMERTQLRTELDRLRQGSAGETTKTQMIGNSMPMQKLKSMIDQVATSRATVLITGESGTGKELVARLVHERSDRADKPFVRLHCSALAETLLESELFGHEKGAFTGAANQRKGRFEEANGGTLFLDEIGEISQSIQVKLLRFLQEREFERVGGNQTISVDVRIIAATNRDLEAEVRSGRFREDLYYRLNVIHLNTPPLRVRRSDIAPLASHLVAKHARRNGKDIKEISPEVLATICQYDWPGNVRELENTVERAVVLATGSRIESSQLSDNFGQQHFVPNDEIRIPGSTLEDIERYAILETYEATGGNSAETSRILGISVRKVQYKLKEYRD
ncbi:sigma-54-dependent transcriptional regulator [Bradymonas sediminis]|uniref:Sigma-54-dependent Fis family transcriptional regulator n=1 Tax=Bradymonas sediminis TaxID=1548548 RepID=A0A2Z4FJB1_9DELT|nr:sigma-54 dependent transcriptional regulator [Bradymonas sediminis]AWV88768.1 sigma-54-dependent Fis family transcriptional regulator [Bradymonas sediminis]TDP61766.1 two component Fis family sigma54 specific transcriptional regulator [Bradymonas sediminis]